MSSIATKKTLTLDTAKQRVASQRLMLWVFCLSRYLATGALPNQHHWATGVEVLANQFESVSAPKYSPIQYSQARLLDPIGHFEVGLESDFDLQIINYELSHVLWCRYLLHEAESSPFVSINYPLLRYRDSSSKEYISEWDMDTARLLPEGVYLNKLEPVKLAPFPSFLRPTACPMCGKDLSPRISSHHGNFRKTKWCSKDCETEWRRLLEPAMQFRNNKTAIESYVLQKPDSSPDVVSKALKLSKEIVNYYFHDLFLDYFSTRIHGYIRFLNPYATVFDISRLTGLPEKWSERLFQQVLNFVRKDFEWYIHLNGANSEESFLKNHDYHKDLLEKAVSTELLTYPEELSDPKETFIWEIYKQFSYLVNHLGVEYRPRYELFYENSNPDWLRRFLYQPPNDMGLRKITSEGEGRVYEFPNFLNVPSQYISLYQPLIDEGQTWFVTTYSSGWPRIYKTTQKIMPLTELEDYWEF